MIRLRSERELKHEVGSDVLEPIGVFLVTGLMIAAIAIGISAFASANISTSDNTAREARVVLNKTLSAAHSTTEIKSRATTLLKLQADGVNTSINDAAYGYITTDQVTAAIKATAQSGRPLSLQNRPYKWAGFRESLWWIGLLFAGLYSSACFVGYAYNASEEHRHSYFIADMPWRQIWPFLFVLFTPLGWPFYIGSLVRMNHQIKDQGLIRPVLGPRGDIYMDANDLRLNHHRQAINEWERLTPDVEQTSSREATKVHFQSAPGAARLQYINMRTSVWRDTYQHRLEHARHKVEDWTETLRGYGESIRKAQLKRNKWIGILAELESYDPSTTEIPGREHLDGEFDRLMALPGVASVRVVNDQICLLIKARIDYNEVTYDLSDWELRFDAKGGLTTKELRSGVRSDWRGDYPVYHLGGNSFCFGSRSYVIAENLNKGQFLEGIELAVNCMNSVNEEDAHRIPDAFREVAA